MISAGARYVYQFSCVCLSFGMSRCVYVSVRLPVLSFLGVLVCMSIFARLSYHFVCVFSVYVVSCVFLIFFCVWLCVYVIVRPPVLSFLCASFRVYVSVRPSVLFFRAWSCVYASFRQSVI